MKVTKQQVDLYNQLALEGDNIVLADYGDYIVLPGIIDCNTNLQDVASEDWEGFKYGTAAAAYGGVTTVVDLPTMKKPSLITVKNLKEHLEAADQELKVDTIFLAYLSDLNLDKIEDLVNEGTVFGFCSFLSAPINRKLDEISIRGLTEGIRRISNLQQNLLLYVDPILSEGRHLYAKSPFRKEKLKKRITNELPQGLNLMAFAFPDSNDGENSEASEDEKEQTILSIDKLNAQNVAKTPGIESQKQQFFSSPTLKVPIRGNTYKNQEPTSAALRAQIKQMREDVQNIAASELMQYDGSSQSLIYLDENKKDDSVDSYIAQMSEMQPDSATSLNSVDVRNTPKILIKQLNQSSDDEDKIELNDIDIQKDVINIKDEHSEKSNSEIKLTFHSNTMTAQEKDDIQVVKADLKLQLHGSMKALQAFPHKLGSVNSLNSQNSGKSNNVNSSEDKCKKSFSELLSPRTMSECTSPNTLDKQRKSSFLEKRQAMIAQRLESQNSFTTKSLQQPIIKGSGNFSQQCSTFKHQGSFHQRDFQTLQLAPVMTKKKEESGDTNSKMQQNYKFFLSLQPSSFEDNGVTQIEDFREKGCKLHFINLSSNMALDRIRQLRKNLDRAKVKYEADTSNERKQKEPVYQQFQISYEISPHLMFFESSDIQDGQTLMKCYPPIRDGREKNLLLLSLKKRYFNVISSNHFPVDPLYKFSVGGNFFKAFNGVGTLGFTLQSLWTIINNNTQIFASDDQQITQEEQNKYLSQLVELLCEKPARLLGIESKKGSLQVGKQADLLVFDPLEEYKVTDEEILSRYPEVNIYLGKTIKGRVRETYLRGNKIFSTQKNEKELVQIQNLGKVLRRIDFTY